MLRDVGLVKVEVLLLVVTAVGLLACGFLPPRLLPFLPIVYGLNVVKGSVSDLASDIYFNSFLGEADDSSLFISLP